jgi:MscS family membrane protein
MTESETIFSDKPFRIGDTIQIGDTNGTVEEIGLRTTNIRRSDQALVIVPNNKFVNTEIINYSAMTKRKIEFYLKVNQDASIYDIKAIVDGIKKIIEENETFDHSSHVVRFTDFGEWSLDIYIYCLVKTTDIAKFQEVREDLNMKIMRLLEDLNIEIAYPSQNIYVYNDDI